MKLAKVLLLIFFTILVFIFSPQMTLGSEDQPSIEVLAKFPGWTFDVDIQGNYAYVAKYEDIDIYDLSDLSNIHRLGNYHESDCLFSAIDVVGSKSFYALQYYSRCSGRYDVNILDVTDPTNPTPVIDQPLNAPGASINTEILVKDNLIFLMEAQAGMKVIDITDLDNPIYYPDFNPTPGFVYRDLDVKDNYAYLAMITGGFIVVDVSDPSNLRLAGKHDLPIGPLAIYHSHGIVVRNDLVYLATSVPGLRIFRMNGVSESAQIGSAASLDYARDIELQDDYAFIADRLAGVSIFDVSDPTNPFLILNNSNMDRTEKLKVQGNIIVAVGGTSFQVLRVSGLDITPHAPEPFLDLPWDYQGKGMSFTEAALAINSYFDHEYPLLSSGLGEPQGVSDSIINYLGPPRSDDSYSRHDGYDYGKSLAKVQLGDKVTAAADGCAIYRYSDAGGNMILIDHGNRYQTRYLHLQEDGLITRSATNCVQVNRGNQIGKVGWTGRVIPAGEKGAHIHFMVVRDKNNDGNFDDNVPDGVTDPFGWQSEEDDPWPKFDFYYNGQDRTGIKSHYLWLKEIASLTEMLVPDEGSHFDLERFSLDFPQGATDESLNISMQSATVTSNNNLLRSIGTAIEVTARDVLGNVVNTFNKPFTLSIEFSPYEIYAYDENSLSIYASQDGINWEKVDSVVFDNRVEAQVDHLSYFALMGERVDITAPLTKLLLSGEKCLENWYYTNVEISLEALDNEGGLGVDYTLYKINDGDWDKYDSPITFVEDGEYQVDFYSVDLDENIEDTKSFEFKIYKTPLDLLISTDPSVLWPPSNKFVDVTIQGSDGFSIKELIVDDEYDEFDQVVSDVTAFGDKIKIMASRKGEDIDGRLYKVGVCVANSEGKVTRVDTQVLVPHDMGN